MKGSFKVRAKLCIDCNIDSEKIILYKNGSSQVHVLDKRRQFDFERYIAPINGSNLLKNSPREELIRFSHEESLSKFELLIFSMYDPDL